MSTVTSFFKGFSNCSRFPYALAVLDCGHRIGVELVSHKGTCYGCKKEITSRADGRFDPCECGTWSCIITFSPDHHNEAHYVTKIGDSIDCEACKQLAAEMAWLEALDASTVFRARYRVMVGNPTYHFYRRDETSPSGVMLIRGVSATPAVDEILRRKGISPLSPTEGMRDWA